MHTLCLRWMGLSFVFHFPDDGSALVMRLGCFGDREENECLFLVRAFFFSSAEMGNVSCPEELELSGEWNL